MNEQWQQKVDWLARQIEYEESSSGGSTLNLDWGGYTIECTSMGPCPQLREALIKLAKDYRRLRELESAGKLGIMR